MPEVLPEVVIVAAYGDQYIADCLDSLGDRYPVVVVDTSDGGHPTGAYLKAYREIPADNYFFMQDSMRVKEPGTDYLEPFRRLANGGVACWTHFEYRYDTLPQREWVEKQYQGAEPKLGLFGPIFYATKAALDKLDGLGLLPLVPSSKEEAQGTERAWAFAFHKAGIPYPAVGGMWDKGGMSRGEYPPFIKIFADRQ